MRQWEDTRSDVLSAVEAVGESGWYILGERVRRFEERIAAYCGRAYAVGCASGLDAIELALRVLGVRPGDKVLTTPLSAFATTLAIVRASGRPVFVDTDEFGLLDLDLADRALEDDAEIRFVVPVHLYGRCLDIGRLMDIQNRHGIPVIEDCAQALGAAHDGRPAGSVALVATLSFYPTKNLGALGDGGALVTDDPEIAELASRLRNYGQGAKFEHLHIGMNSRLDLVPDHPRCARGGAAVTPPPLPARSGRAMPPGWGTWCRSQAASDPELPRRGGSRATARGLPPERGPVGGRGGGAHRQPLPGTREAWPQRVGWLSLRKVHQAAPADALEAAPGAPLEATAEDSQRSPAIYAAQSSMSRRRSSNRSVRM